MTKGLVRLNISMMLLCGLTTLCQAEILSLSSAVNTALEKNPAILGSAEKLNQTDATISQTKSALFPTLNATATAYQKQDATAATSVLFGGEKYNQYVTDLKLSQPLLVKGSLDAVSASRLSKEISKRDVDIAKRNLISNVIQTYFQALVYSRNVETLEHQEKIVQESLSVAQKREHYGRGQLLDVLQIKTQLALLKAQISTARNQRAIAVATLSNLMANQIPKEFTMLNTFEIPEIAEVDQNMTSNDVHIPEVEKDRLLIQQLELQKSVTLGQNLPYLSFIGDYNFSSYKSSDLYSSSTGAWYVGLQLTIPLFSGFSSIYQQHVLSSQKIQAEFDQQNVELQFQLQQISNRKNLESAKDSIVSGVEALKLANQSSDEAKKNYKLATIDFLQFLTVQQSLVQAEQALNNSKYTYISALVSLYSASGQSMEKLVTLIERKNQK